MIDETWFVRIFRNEPYPPRTVFREAVAAEEEEEECGPEAMEAEREGARMLWAAALEALLGFPEAYAAVLAAVREVRRRFTGLPAEPVLEGG